MNERSELLILDGCFQPASQINYLICSTSRRFVVLLLWLIPSPSSYSYEIVPYFFLYYDDGKKYPFDFLPRAWPVVTLQWSGLWMHHAQTRSPQHGALHLPSVEAASCRGAQSKARGFGGETRGSGSGAGGLGPWAAVRVVRFPWVLSVSAERGVGCRHAGRTHGSLVPAAGLGWAGSRRPRLLVHPRANRSVRGWER